MNRDRLWPYSILLAVAIAISVSIGLAWSNDAASRAPVQPIDFSHRDHVRGDGLDCELCHSGVRRAAFAGMPPVARCMGCHRFVLPQNPGVAALRRYWDSGTAIPWIRVNTLPRFVHFSHEAHVRANVACAHCHGEVADMSRVVRVAPLTMGWCVDCHRASRATDDCLACHY